MNQVYFKRKNDSLGKNIYGILLSKIQPREYTHFGMNICNSIFNHHIRTQKISMIIFIMNFLLFNCARKRVANDSTELGSNHSSEEGTNLKVFVPPPPEKAHLENKIESKRIFIAVSILDYPCDIDHLDFVSYMYVTVDQDSLENLYPFFCLAPEFNSPENVYHMILKLKKSELFLLTPNINPERLKLIFFEFPCVNKIYTEHFETVKGLRMLLGDPVKDFIALFWLKKPQSSINTLFWHLYEDNSFLNFKGVFYEVIDSYWADLALSNPATLIGGPE